MTDFKIGDRVERINGSNYDMKVGDTGTICKNMGANWYLLEEYPECEHNGGNLRLVTKINWRKRLENGK